MQQLARRQRLETLRLVARRWRDAPAAAERVLAVADDRAADVREVHPDLMGAAGAQPHAQQIGVGEPRHERRVRDGVAAALRDRHALALFGMPGDRRFDVHRTLAQMAPHERRVHALDGAPLDRARESPVREVALRDHQQAGRVAIQPVHDAGSAFRRSAGELGPAAHQHVHQRVVPVAGTGMHDQARRLVEHREMLVLEHKA